MKELLQAIKTTPLVYVTRDIERALGLPANANYHIITNSTRYATEVAKKRKNILRIKGASQLDTRELLAHPKTKAYIHKLKTPQIVVFKNTLQIEKLCAENGWKLLNPPAVLANKVEEKISQLQWLGELTRYLPPFHIQLGKDLLWSGEKYIVQFNRAHTGSGTILIESEKQLNELKKQFPNREVRVTQYISGPAFTNNNVVFGKKILIGNINYQITGLPPFTARPFATIGNDWALPKRVLSTKSAKYYARIATDVGKKLTKDGWRGLFGIDVIMDEKTGKLYLIEINARQPASTTYESQLQNAQRITHNSCSTFEAHLASLLELRVPRYELRHLSDGAQVVLKNKEKRVKSNELNQIVKNLKSKIKNLKLIAYDNTAPESDLLRIQSKKGIMSKHNEFNSFGDNIVASLQTRPDWLNKINPPFRWSREKLWRLKAPVVEMDIQNLTWQLDLPFWEKEGTDDWNLTPREALEHPHEQPTHYKKILDADTGYPLVVMKIKGKWRILDGLHRLTKLYMEGVKYIRVRIVNTRNRKQIII